MCGNEKKFSWRKFDCGTADIAGETTNNRELSEQSCFAGFIKIPFPDFEKRMADQQFAFRFDQLRLHICEIDTLNGLLNVQIPLPAGSWIGSVPIERPVSGIAILLNFDQEIPRAHGMNTAGWEESGITCLDADSMNMI